MAVHERSYRVYPGPETPGWSRFLVIPRYAYRDVFRSRLFTAFFAACFLWPVGCAVLIYLHHNVGALAVLGLSPRELILIDADFFLSFLYFQGTMLGFLVAFIVGPGLISSDLRHNAVPLYLARPFSRAEYVAGKMCVLVGLVSSITWVPGVLLAVLHAYFEDRVWSRETFRMGAAILVASWIWILVLGLLTLAVSALVKWRPAASGVLLGVFFVGAALGSAINELFGTHWGSLINLGQMVVTVWSALFGTPSPGRIPPWAAWGALLTLCGVCLLLLARRVRAYEVAR